VWNATRDTFSKPGRNDFPKMPPPDGAGISWGMEFLHRYRADGAGLCSKRILLTISSKRLQIVIYAVCCAALRVPTAPGLKAFTFLTVFTFLCACFTAIRIK
jgi:hypothetical protein